MPMQRVLVAVEDTTQALEAARTAAGLAHGWHAAVRVLTAIEHSAGTERRAEAQRLLDHVVRAIRIADGPVEGVLRAGEAFRCILDEANAWHAHLIVMATSDQRGLRSGYIGSATEHVLEFATCPVLVVPCPERDAPRADGA